MGLFDLLTEIIKAKKDKKDSQVVVKNYISGNNNQNNNSNNNIEDFLNIRKRNLNN